MTTGFLCRRNAMQRFYRRNRERILAESQKKRDQKKEAENK